MSNDETPTGLWKIVAEREISTRLREKAFTISALLMVAAVVVSIVLSSVLGGKPKHYDVAVTDSSSAAIVASASKFVDNLATDSTAVAKQFPSAESAEQAVRSGEVDAALLPTDSGFEIVGDDGIDNTLASALSSAVSTETLSANAQKQNVDLAALQQNTQVKERFLDPTADSSNARSAVAFYFVLLFYITAVTFGMAIAQSVTQEKESRIVEILAAAIPIRSLLWGKILGNTVLALAQVVALMAAGIATLAAVGKTDLLNLISPALAWYVLFFVLGFVALSSLWAVAGSLASRQQDLQSTTLPGHVLLFGPYFLVIIGGETLKTVVSMLPVVSAMVMPARLAEGSVPLWQILVALAANIVATVVLVKIGARVYERTLLRTGSRIKYAEALRIRS